MLATELQLIKTTTADHLKEGELLADVLDTPVPLEAVFVGDVDVGTRLAVHPVGNDLRNKFVGDKADDDSDR